MSSHIVRTHRRRDGTPVRAHSRTHAGTASVAPAAADAARAAADAANEIEVERSSLGIGTGTEPTTSDLIAILTEATCGEACWTAVHDVCRCSCGGANHGIRQRGGEAERTCKVGSNRYRLIAVMTEAERPYTVARELIMERQADQSPLNLALRSRWGPPNVIAVEPATRAQEKWPELAVHAGWREPRPDDGARLDIMARRPHLIWELMK